MHCDWFIHLLLLPTPTIWFSLDHKWNLSDRVISGVGRTKFVNGNVRILLRCFLIRFRNAFDSMHSRLQFLIFTRSFRSYDSVCNSDSDSDSVSENQPLGSLGRKVSIFAHSGTA